VGLQNSFPANAARFAGVSIGPFQSVELAYYWTQTSGGVRGTGKQVFSFGSGDSDVTEINDVYYYALPMVPKQYGPIGGAAAAPTCSGSSPLALYTQGSAANQAVYDCETGITWLTNANLAAKDDFDLKGDLPGGIHYNRPYPSKHPITLKAPLIDGGAMLWDTAQQWINAMNAPKGGPGYLGSKHWQLPGSPADLRTLYEHLQLGAGDARLMSERTVGPFHNLQPFFYWETCVLKPNDAKGASACAKGNAPSGKAGRQMNFDFTFGYGLLSTDLATLNYFVMVYYPAKNKAPAPPAPGPIPRKPPPPPCPPGLRCPKPI